MSATVTSSTDAPSPGRKDQTMLLFAGLMEGGKEDFDTVADLKRLTGLLDQDAKLTEEGEPSITAVIDADCVDTLVCYLDMRQSDAVRTNAMLCTAAYLKAAGEEGNKRLSDFFHARMKRHTYDDYIVAFCVAKAIFPIVPEFAQEMLLTEGFLSTLGPLMRRTWKSKKVETACLEMLSAACYRPQCRIAIRKYCTDWLEEIVDEDLEDAVRRSVSADVDTQEEHLSMKQHCHWVRELAGLVVLKLWVSSHFPEDKAR